jgi:hypothetical protein
MGFVAIIVALGSLGFALWQHLKGQRVLAAPFRRTGELASDPTSSDPKGAMSTEGQVVPPQTPLKSACSQVPCLYYEVTVTRIYEERVKQQDGTYRTVKRSSLAHTERKGAEFAVDDGTGGLRVDATHGGDFDCLKKGYEKEINWGGASRVDFGSYRFDVPPSDSDTIGFKAVEKFVPAEGKLFVLGKIDGGRLTKPGWRSMIFSNRGRDGLLASTAKKKKIGFGAGGASALAAIPLFLSSSVPCDKALKHFKPGEKPLTCENETLIGNVSTFEVPVSGGYELVLTPDPKVKGPKLELKVKSTKVIGGSVFSATAEESGKPVTLSVYLEAGSYDLYIDDVARAGQLVKYQLKVGKGDAKREAPVAAPQAGRIVDPLAAEPSPVTKKTAAAAPDTGAKKQPAKSR